MSITTSSPTSTLVNEGQEDAHDRVQHSHQTDRDSSRSHHRFLAVLSQILLKISRRDESDVLSEEEENEAHAIDDDAKILQEGRDGLGPQIAHLELERILDEAKTRVDPQDREYMIMETKPMAIAKRPREEMPTSILR